MNGLTAWGMRHHVPAAAMNELRTLLAAPSNGDPSPLIMPPGSEGRVSNEIRLEASRAGGRLWRNNVGAGKLENGSFVRWGLCNDSAELNKHCKSADLIGIRPILITHEHVGRVIGQFLSREAKHAGWSYTGTDREQAQLRWIESINAMGGDACFATSVGTISGARITGTGTTA